MNRILIPLMLFVGFLMTGCGKDDEPKLELTGEFLEATTWDAVLTGSTYPNHKPISSHFVMQFLTKDSGKNIAAYEDDSYEGAFTYHITKRMITFNGSIVGNWTVVEHTKTKIVLQAFLPNEFNLVLTNIY